MIVRTFALSLVVIGSILFATQASAQLGSDLADYNTNYDTTITPVSYDVVNLDEATPPEEVVAFNNYGPLRNVDWGFSFAALTLDRGDYDLTSISPILGTTNFGTISFDPGYKVGYELEGTMTIKDEHQVKARWFESGKWADQETRTVDDPLSITGTFDYRSDLQSFEIGYRRKWCWYFNPSLSYRHMKMDAFKREFIVDSNTNLTTYLESDIGNELHGIQLGIDGILLDRGWVVFDYYAKYALTDLDASASFVHEDGSLGLPFYTRILRADESAVYELGLNARFAISHRSTFYCGIRWLWMSDLTDAQNVGPASFAFTELREETAYFHGFNLGYEMQW